MPAFRFVFNEELVIDLASPTICRRRLERPLLLAPKWFGRPTWFGR